MMKHDAVEMKQVHSSHIRAVGYDGMNEELHIEYNTGKHFVYKNVPRDKAHMVMNGASIGTALHRHIKGQHDHEIL